MNLRRIDPYTVTKDIEGTKFTAQFNGLSFFYKVAGECNKNGSVDVEKLHKYIFENVIVEPRGLTDDHFESVDDCSKVTEFAQEVMSGRFRGQADGRADTPQGAPAVELMEAGIERMRSGLEYSIPPYDDGRGGGSEYGAGHSHQGAEQTQQE